eukprot:COSAG01_NODE_6354_length_3718_cov_7.547665_3_plen_196_part_00
MTHPPCRGSTQPCAVQSGLQKLVLRRNGFVSLSTRSVGAGNAAAVGTFKTEPFKLPKCSASQALSLHLNIFAAIGRGALVDIYAATGSHLLARSTTIQGGGVDFTVEWEVPAANNVTYNMTREWVNGGCAFEAHERNVSLPAGECDRGNYHRTCNTTKDCDCYVDKDGHTGAQTPTSCMISRMYVGPCDLAERIY